jgi:serine/threonine protein kinase
MSSPEVSKLVSNSVIETNINLNDYQILGTGSYSQVYDLGKYAYKDGYQYDDEYNIDRPTDEYVEPSLIREIASLKELSNNANIVQIKDIMITEKMHGYSMVKYPFVLNKLIGKFDTKLIKRTIFQLLVAINTSHNNFIIHRDIKPANILFDDKMNLYLGDWGLSVKQYEPFEYPNFHVQTIWYRAPEVLLYDPTYSSKIDIWSIGIIMIELIKKIYGIVNGNKRKKQIALIFNTFGYLNKEEQKYYENLIDINYESEYPKSINFSTFLGDCEICADGIDLLVGLLKYNPNERLSATTALRHKYFDDLVLPKLEQITVTKEDVDIKEIKKLNNCLTDKIRQKIMKMIIYLHVVWRIEIYQCFSVLKIFDIISSKIVIDKDEVWYYVISIMHYFIKLYTEESASVSYIYEKILLDQKYEETLLKKYIYKVPKIIDYNFYRQYPLLIVKILCNRIKDDVSKNFLMYTVFVAESSYECILYGDKTIIGTCISLTIKQDHKLTWKEIDILACENKKYKSNIILANKINEIHLEACKTDNFISLFCRTDVKHIYNKKIST